MTEMLYEYLSMNLPASLSSWSDIALHCLASLGWASFRLVVSFWPRQYIFDSSKIHELIQPPTTRQRPNTFVSARNEPRVAYFWDESCKLGSLGVWKRDPWDERFGSLEGAFHLMRNYYGSLQMQYALYIGCSCGCFVAVWTSGWEWLVLVRATLVFSYLWPP